ncbi:hypothetical protein A6V39_00840 [Candidatus Mycoplasma haematobovis]|uniref:Uncharacterized protein n=1 Tax=Candidatus Mycoplasma haematobovis TaxID=432608 RepID=A0A1A9QED3_9MOLU|nr:hypothetical protein [Candidatus Mycoplasma haematobovis]OAL10598.1 hypothetical protein A6V39_00840 [Candidatus Mycoplasma haematobovis]
MQPVWKVGCVVGALGVAGGSDIAISSYLNKGYSNISERLTGAGYKVLDVNGDDSEWRKVLVAYNKIRESTDIFTGSTATQETKPNLISKCKEVLSLNPTEETNYTLAKRWCVKEELMKDMLTRNGYTKLVTSSTGNNKPKWLDKVRRLRTETKGAHTIAVELKNNDDQDIAALEVACTALNIDAVKTHTNKDFEKNYVYAKEWCYEKNNSQ